MRTCFRCGHTGDEQHLQRSTHAYVIKYECIDRRACARRETARSDTR